MTGTRLSEGPMSRAGLALLGYLHAETDAMWSLADAPVGTSFPLVDSDGQGLGFLCMIYDGDPSRYGRLGAAVAAALALICRAESETALAGDPMTDGGDTPFGGPIDSRITAYFQPIVELQTGHVVAIEALARMQVADGVLTPDAFLEQYSSGEAMLGLFDRMLELSLRFLSDHRHRRPDLSAVIKLDFAGIPERGLPDLITDRLGEFSTDPDSITIELSGRVAHVLTDAAVDQLLQITGIGVTLLLDDVFSNFDSVARVAGIPVSGAKLNRRYVSQLHGGEHEVMAVRTALHHAQQRGIELIAGGIETRAQCETLMQLGCRFGQGYLFAVPQPATSLSAVLEGPLVGHW